MSEPFSLGTKPSAVRSGRWIRRGKNILILSASQPSSGEVEGEVTGPRPIDVNIFINPRIDVDAQRALMEMARSPNPSVRADAMGVLTMIDSGFLFGIFKPDQEVPARLERSRGGNWWTMIRPGRQARLLCHSPGKALMVFRKNLTRAELIRVLRLLAARERRGRGVSRLCLTPPPARTRPA
jgi:hypothetical protein